MSRPVVAAFDLDGTLSKHDTLIPFLRRAVGTRRVAWSLARGSGLLLRARRDRSLRDAAKEALLVATIGGRPESELRAVGRELAPIVSLRDDVVAHLRRHQAAGHETVLVSASPALYVDAVADVLGVDSVVATELEVVDGLVTGRYAGRNCRADEKLRRLLEWLGDRDVELHAYGNSPDDDAMLAQADVALPV